LDLGGRPLDSLFLGFLPPAPCINFVLALGCPASGGGSERSLESKGSCDGAISGSPSGTSLFSFSLMKSNLANLMLQAC